MRSDTLSRTYAEALADVAQQQGVLPRVRQELLQLDRALAEEPAFERLVRTPARPLRAKRRIFRQIAERLDLCGPTRRLLNLLVDKKRGQLLPQIARVFTEVADRRLGIVAGRVTSAAPLSEAQMDRIRQRLEDITDKQVRLEQELDESLIAGFQVRLDGNFYDGSLRARLKRIRERIAHGG